MKPSAVQIIHNFPDTLPQVRALVPHPRRLAPDDLRLVALGRGAVDLGTRVVVEYEKIKAEPSRQRALAVLPGDFDIGQPNRRSPSARFQPISDPTTNSCQGAKTRG
jgi:hypothetical protein